LSDTIALAWASRHRLWTAAADFAKFLDVNRPPPCEARGAMPLNSMEAIMFGTHRLKGFTGDI
jgi:hypothetical protein